MSPPIIFATWICFIYSTFSTCSLIPQILRQFEIGPACRLATIAGLTPNSKTGDQNCLLHHQYKLDPHVHQSSLQELLMVLLGFHFIFILFLISLWKVSTTEPGWIPRNNRWQGEVKDEIAKADEDRIGRMFSNIEYRLLPEDRVFIRKLLIVERKMQNGNMRECLTCRLYKPDRSHHCHVCNRCVMRMDHHCVWISNCVGFYNYKYFVLMLFYVLLTIAFVLLAMLPRFVHIFRPIVGFKYFICMDMVVFFTYLLTTFIFSNVLPFFIYHVYLCLHAMTTIEMREKLTTESEELRHCSRLARIKWNQGYWKNWTHIFGPPWMWFIPIPAAKPGIAYDGTYARPKSVIEV